MDAGKLITQTEEPKWLKWVGYDAAIIGRDYNQERFVYSQSKMLDIYLESTGEEAYDMEDDHDPVLEAYDFLNHNCWTAYIGENTPIICADYEFNLNEQEQ